MYFNIIDTGMQNGDETTEHHFGWSMSFSENAHNSSNAPYSLIKFCIQYLYI